MMLLFLLIVSNPIAFADDAPPRSDSGQTLAVPEKWLDIGEVYHVFPGQDTQLTITSDSDIQRVTAANARVVGFVVSPFDLEGSDPPLAAGALRIPVHSFRTAAQGLDDALASMLDAKKYPEITVAFKRLDHVELVEKTTERAKYQLDITADLTIKDNTREVTAHATVELIAFSFATMMARYPGDLMTIRASFSLKPADFDLRPSRSPQQSAPALADQLNVELFLLLNTTPPDKSLDPAVPDATHIKQQHFMTLLRDLGDEKQAYAFGRAFMQEIWDDAAALNTLAAGVLEKDVRSPDLNFARRASLRACELDKNMNASHLDTLASICFRAGYYAAAVNWQRKALEALGDAPPPVVAEIKRNLERYEQRGALRGP